MFKDRKDAGLRLAKALEHYKKCNGFVLAIPKGGVEVGFYIAKNLEIPMSIIISRKLPFPDNPEAGFGAITEDESTYFVSRVYDRMSLETIQKTIDQQKEEMKRRIQILRNGEPLPEITNKTIILVDDGIAMGSTMQAAVMLCRNKKAKRIVIAAPVTGMDTAMEMARIADEVVIVEKPPDFCAVADNYQKWYDVSDEEVIRIMKKLSDKFEGNKNEKSSNSH